MRIVLFTEEFPRVSETFVASKFAGLVERGLDVHVVCLDASREPWGAFRELVGRPELERRVHVLRLGKRPVRIIRTISSGVRASSAAHSVLRSVRSTEDLRAALEAARLLALRPDILHFEFGALAVGRTHLKRLLGCRLTVSFRGYDLNYAGIDQPAFYDDVWREADGIHCLGEDLWRRALRRGCPPEMPHALISPAVDAEFFAPSAGAPAGGERLRLLSVGRLHWKKGYEYSLMALRALVDGGVDAELRIVGGGPHEEAVRASISDLELEERVSLLGARTPVDVRAEFAGADVFVHAATSEGFSNAVLEAQAMEVPVVCTDADGLRENVADGETGFVVPRRDAAALASAIRRLADDPQLRGRLGKAGRRRVLERFRPEAQIDAFVRFYEAALRSR